MKKFFIAMNIFIVAITLSSMVYATTTETFEVVDDQICTIQLNDYCKFEKKMIDANLTQRQVTIQLKITNDSVANQPTGEVMLVLDNSGSMNEPIEAGSTTTRGDVVFSSAKSLITKMLNNNNSLKVGIVKFSTNTDISKEGTSEDAALVSELSNDSTKLNDAIDNIQKDGPRTNLDSGLTIASQYFSSENTNKYIIVLTDGVPNVAIDYGGNLFSDDVINKTKNKLQELSRKYTLITMLTGIDNENINIFPRMPIGSTDITYAKYIEAVFGTTTSPSYNGKFYKITDNQIEQTITNDIYNDLLPQSQSIKDIIINDFFPKEIVDNFDFAYLSQPSKGTISKAIDDERKIVWELDELASNETATVQYTLTLKDNYDSSIVNKILDTNEKVDITYKDFDETDKNKTSDETPKVRIVRISQNDTPAPAKSTPNDNTTAPNIIPKAGQITLFTIFTVLIVYFMVSGTGILKINYDIRKQK